MPKRPLRVMHVIASLEIGGVESLLANSLAAFDPEKCRHHVCCVTRGGVYEANLRALGIPFWIMKRRMRFDPTLPWQMTQLMRQQHIDVVHTLGFTGNFWGRVAAKLSGVPRIIAHETGTGWTENVIMRLADRCLASITDVWLANSHAAERILSEHIGVPKRKIKVIYNGVPKPDSDVSPFLREKLGLSTVTPLVGTIGRLNTPKGHQFLLKAIPLVWRTMPEAHFVIVGGGPLEAILLAEATRLIATGKIHFLGFVKNASNLMAELDILVQPSIRESFGNVLVEAGYAHIPAIAVNVDGPAEIIVDGETGILLDPVIPIEPWVAEGASSLPTTVVDGRTRQLITPKGPDPRDLAHAILSLLRNPEKRKEMGRAGFRRAQQQFTIDRFVRQLEAVYLS